MKIKLQVFLLALMALAGCKKSDPVVPTTAKIYLLTQVISIRSGFIDTTSYAYDDMNRIIEFHTYANERNRITYDNNRITEINSYNTSNPNTLIYRSVFTYNLPTITIDRIDYSLGQIKSTNKEFITVNDKQMITEYKRNIYDSFSTYDDKNNIVTFMTYVTGIKNPVENYSNKYDSNKNPLSQVVGNILLIYSQNLSFANNLIYSDNDLGGGFHNYINNNYEYNSDGFPTKKTEIRSASNVNNSISTSLPNTYLYIYTVK